MTTAKQRAWRAKFAKLYGGGKHRRKKSYSGGNMARKRSYRRASSGGLLSNKGIIGSKIGFGAIGSVIAGMLAVEAFKAISPQLAENDIARAAAGYVAGGTLGAATAYIARDGIPGIQLGVKAQTPVAVNPYY